MKYWVIKGNPKWYNWDRDLRPGFVERWGTRSLPAEVAPDDRLFLWESGGHSRVIGFGEVVLSHLGKDRDGRETFTVRYLTGRFQATRKIKDLGQIAALRSASFLQPGPFATVYPLSDDQARALYRAVILGNDHEHIWRDLGKPGKLITPPELEAEALEGNPKLVTHLVRERAPGLAKKKKDHFRKRHGTLFCEACEQRHSHFGELAESAFEVHHRKPLGELVKAAKTTLSDLAVVCANCHRAIHRHVPMISVAQLSKQIKTWKPATT